MATSPGCNHGWLGGSLEPDSAFERNSHVESCCSSFAKSAPSVACYSELSDGVQFYYVVCLSCYADLALAFAVIVHMPPESLLRLADYGSRSILQATRLFQLNFDKILSYCGMKSTEKNIPTRLVFCAKPAGKEKAKSTAMD
ncbi:hypothetical protein [Lampropedia hyalina]|uniref:hypothetical protein n=1 Tax=Lampropedia hyalina TaxID=198706 RepID=UPI001161410D|nr:hypothetical protein [Lampropedia hyalina]